MLDVVKKIARGVTEKHPFIAGAAMLVGVAAAAKTVMGIVAPSSTAQPAPTAPNIPGLGG